MTDRARILLVDDRPENLLALEAILGPLDQTLVRANSGEEALRALLLDDYALILLDARMPGMDGFETAARIKGRDRSKDVPIIFLTAVDTDEHLAYRGYAAGAADYLAKPFDPWLLRAKVQVFVDLWRTREQVAAQGSFLRRQLDDPNSPVDVLAELDVRLTDVEAAVAQLGNEAGPSDALTRVKRRLQELRNALGALSTRAG